MAIAQAALRRQSCQHSARRFEGAVALSRAAALAEEPARGLLFARCPGEGAAVMCIKLEQVTQRYLLATDSKAGVHLFDCALARGAGPEARLLATWSSPAAHPGADGAVAGGGGAPQRRTTALYEASTRSGGKSGGGAASASAQPPSLYSDACIPAHSSAVTTCSWYTVDSSLFLTGGMDGSIVSWDAAAFLPAYSWAVGGPVFCIDMHAASPGGGAGEGESRANRGAARMRGKRLLADPGVEACLDTPRPCP